MATGWLEKGICFANQQDAVDMHFQAIPPTINETSTKNSITSYVKQTNGVWTFNRVNISATGSQSQQYSITASAPFQAACENPNDPTSNFLNGMELGWCVATVMVVVFVIRRTYRGF